MCSEWNALVLIDEADIFIEARNSSELQRNAVVCVMLRLLEYYNGGLFLTTNRVGNVDPAVSSRITVMLGYDPLNAEGREKVWRNLLGTSASEKIKALTKDEYRHLASYVLNGRQIKNSILLGKALSKERGEPLSLVTLERAVRAVAGEREAAETRTERIHSRESPSAWGSSGVVNFPAAGRLTMSPLEGSFAPH
ncbi:unnamed protein product [Amoebophrya sp. A25]|nr:unnamed protein product [Amoebophrya sp. A25]|eukprot:GSA25T00017683001.1